MTLREAILKEALIKDYKTKYYNEKISNLDAEEEALNKRLLKSKIAGYRSLIDGAYHFNKYVNYLNKIIEQIKKVEIRTDEETLAKLNSIKYNNNDELKHATEFIKNYLDEFDASRYSGAHSELENIKMNKQDYKSKLDKITKK